MTSSEVKSALLTHCEVVYAAMKATAQEVHEGDVPMIVWEGFFTRLMRELDLAVPYYSTIRNFLLQMGCVRQLRRGGGTTPSQWELIRPPTMELWQQLPERPTGKPGPSPSAVDTAELATLRQRITDLSEQVESLTKGQELLVKLYNQNVKKKESA